MNKMKQLFKITCTYCNETYNYRMYKDSKIVYEDVTKPKGVYEEHTSHGICKECIPGVYKEVGLEKIINK